MTQQSEILLIGSANKAFSTLAGQFKTTGKDVVIIDTVDAAKKRLSDGLPGLVIISVDTMPEPFDLVRELAFLYRGLPVLVAAERGSVHEASEAIAQGASDYILLPIDSEIVKGLVNNYVSATIDPELGRGRHLITGDPKMLKLLTQVRRVAQSRATVLVQGESGTGKELIARYIHQVSDRAEKSFVALNCAALPENLLESELFGHIKGAFTGATGDRKGKFLQANGGTIFLDEISEMSLKLQAKLLRVLQEGEVDPVGGRKPVQVDVRVIASTNRELKSYAEEGHFREDLFYRLNVFPVQLPPLRVRTKDVILLAEHFRRRFTKEFGRNDIPFSNQALAALEAAPWPGNVRELENVVQRALLMAESKAITPEDLMIDPAPAGAAPSTLIDAGGTGVDQIQMPLGTTVREMEEILIRHTLNEVDGNRTRAAEMLGISIRTLRNKLNEYASRVSATA
ncbi:MAG: sigma-54-dependent Fis family transcriptional regulator [Magnetococcales bacterium]|nr:sigma-54-dependent Fis family transcriptional regulator [Magnetococcales bacterium]